jgi:hypothetical protein
MPRVATGRDVQQELYALVNLTSPHHKTIKVCKPNCAIILLYFVFIFLLKPSVHVFIF